MTLGIGWDWSGPGMGKSQGKLFRRNNSLKNTSIGHVSMNMCRNLIGVQGRKLRARRERASRTWLHGRSIHTALWWQCCGPYFHSCCLGTFVLCETTVGTLTNRVPGSSKCGKCLSQQRKMGFFTSDLQGPFTYSCTLWNSKRGMESEYKFLS